MHWCREILALQRHTRSTDEIEDSTLAALHGTLLELHAGRRFLTAGVDNRGATAIYIMQQEVAKCKPCMIENHDLPAAETTCPHAYACVVFSDQHCTTTPPFPDELLTSCV